MTSTLRRLSMPVLGLVAAAGMVTACSSSTIGGTGVAGGSIGASSNGPSAGSSGDFGSASVPQPSDSAPVASASSDGGGANSAGDAAFCTTFRTKLGTIQNAGSDPSTAADTFDALAAVAPPAIKADVQYVATALHQALAGKVPDTTKIEQATVRVSKYYVTNCH